MNYQTAKLAAKVAATNRANKNALALYAAFSAAAKPFVGQKIFKADGELTAKFKAALPSFPFRFYQYTSSYSLLYIAKESENITGHCGCIYAEASAYVGSMTNGVLVNLLDAPILRVDFTVEEIATLREATEKAEEIVSALKSKLSSFGLYD